MPQGEYKSKRSSGFQQRKARQTREQALKQYEGSMLRFVKQSEKSPLLDDRKQNQDIAEVLESTTLNVFESDVTTPIAPVNVSEDGESDVHIDDPTPSQQPTTDALIQDQQEQPQSSSHVGEIIDLNFMVDASHWKVPVSDHMRLDIVKSESDVFRKLDGPFVSKFRQGNTKSQQRHLTKDWFY